MIMTIELRNIKLYAFHGCYAEEQLVGNHFIVDADLEVDAACAISTDQVTDALNYVEACQAMQQVMAQPCHLLESVVANITAELRNRFASKGLCGGWVRVRKMAPPIGMDIESVGVKAQIF